MSNTTKKQPMSVVKKMMIALVGGLLVGIAFLLLREQLISSGNEGAWTILNKILFQDITAEDGVSAIGLFYIIGQLFMRGLQLAIVPLVLVSLSLAMCSISSSTKLVISSLHPSSSIHVLVLSGRHAADEFVENPNTPTFAIFLIN